MVLAFPLPPWVLMIILKIIGWKEIEDYGDGDNDND
jgi:hypothetical protein